MKFIFGKDKVFFLILATIVLFIAGGLVLLKNTSPIRQDSSLLFPLFILFVLLTGFILIRVLKIEKTIDALFIFGMIFLAVLARYQFFGYQSGDYLGFLNQWYDFIKTNGGFEALKHNFSDYNPPYLYFLSAITYFPVYNLFAIKIISVVFDFMAGIFVALIVRQKYPRKPLPAIFAFLAIIFAPTVILNGSYWGQCDVIFTSFLVAAVYFLIKGKSIPAVIFYALALAFKLQAIFLAPLFLIMILAKKIKIWHLPMAAAVYILALAPAAIAGRPLKELLTIYFVQTQVYKMLVLNAPTIYQWLPQSQESFFYPAGLVLAGIAALVLVYLVLRSKAEISPDLIIKISAVCVTLLPFILPRMHERYFFAADIFLIIFAFYFLRYFFLPIAMQAISFLSYRSFLFEKPVDYESLALAMLGVVTVCVYALVSELYFKKEARLNDLVGKEPV